MNRVPSLGFGEWIIGMELVTKRRTISENDIIAYTQMTGYANENLFGDMVYLMETMKHPRRLAPGLLTASIADALIVGSGVIEGHAVALVGMNNMVAKHPVYAGDSIHVEIVVTHKKESQSKPDRGVVVTHQKVINQNGIVVLEYDVSRMLLKKAAL